MQYYKKSATVIKLFLIYAVALAVVAPIIKNKMSLFMNATNAQDPQAQQEQIQKLLQEYQNKENGSVNSAESQEPVEINVDYQEANQETNQEEIQDNIVNPQISNNQEVNQNQQIIEEKQENIDKPEQEASENITNQKPTEVPKEELEKMSLEPIQDDTLK